MGTSNGYLLDTYPGNSLRLIVERGSLGYDAKLAPGKWVHVAATVDADGGQALYVDGKGVAAARRDRPAELSTLARACARIAKFHERLVAAGLGETSEAAHARLAVGYLATTAERVRLLAQGKLPRLAESSQYAADKSYFATTVRLCDGLERTVASYQASQEPHKRQIARLWGP